MRIETYLDDEMGCIAAAYDDEGRIIATAADSVRDGVYTAVDESSFFEATGQLLPDRVWDAASRHDKTPPAQPEG